jgi:hypothetical protein
MSDVRIMQRKKVNHNQVKVIVDQVKVLMKRESDPEVRRNLATAGISLNNILMK